MKTNTITLRKLFLVSTALFLITFLSCKDDPIAPLEEKPVDATTIGVEGGIIQKDDFTLTIPAGAFDKNYDISVSAIADDGVFGENTVTSTYKISGLPDETNKSLKIKLKYNGALSNNTYVIVDTKSKEDSLVSSGLFTATDSSGYMISNILKYSGSGYGALSKGTKINDNSTDKVIRGVTDFIEQESPNFLFHIPSSLEADIGEFKNNCENTLKFIKEDVGLNFFPVVNSRNVVLRKNTWNPLKSAIGAEIGIQIYFYVDISEVINKKFDRINADMGALLFELESPREKFNTNHFIFRSFKYIIKELIYEDGDFILQFDLEKNKFEPFNGWVKENTDNSAIGFTPIIKYLTSNSLFGLSGIGEMFKKVNEGSSLQDALINSIDASTKEWLPDFIKKYVNNELYKFSGDYFLSETYKEWNINSETDTLKAFASSEVGTYQDLSAKFFKINFNYSGFESTQKLSLLMNGPNNNQGLSLILFSIKDNKVEYIGTSNEVGAELQDLKGYYGLGVKQILAILVNSNIISNDYLGQSIIDLTLKINSKNSGGGQPGLDYNHCRIDVYLNGVFEDSRWPAGTTQEYPISFSTYHDYWDYEDTVRTIEGSFSGNTFSGSYNSGDGRTQTATVTLNDAYDMITNYSWAEVDETFSDRRIARGVSGQNIPIKNVNDKLYEIRGVNACSGVATALYFSQIQSDSLTLIGYGCNENSRVVIQFYKK